VRDLIMVDEKIVEAVKKAREDTKKRNFKQSFDLAISLKNIDLKKAENKIKTEIAMPHGFGKEFKIGIIADILVSKAKELGDKIILIKKDDLERLGKDKKQAKKMAKKCKAFVAEAPLMPLVGKNLGPILAPRGLMPQPVPPTLPSFEPIIKRSSSSLKIALKTSPVVHCLVGNEDMDDTKIAENIEAVIKGLRNSLPRGKEQLKLAYVKLSMGKPHKFDL